jgi:DNA repair exonuclease SbcCD ATPase subunit
MRASFQGALLTEAPTEARNQRDDGALSLGRRHASAPTAGPPPSRHEGLPSEIDHIEEKAMNDRAQHDERHQAYLDKAKAELNELDAQIGVLEAKAESRAADARIDYRNALHDLEDRRDELGAHLKKLQDASGDAWNDLQGGLESAMANMRDSLKNAVARFR